MFEYQIYSFQVWKPLSQVLEPFFNFFFNDVHLCYKVTFARLKQISGNLFKTWTKTENVWS